MESNKLLVLENTLPLKAYPPKKLDEILETSFLFWLANLLSIKADKKESVLSALPEVKYHFHSLGVDQVKKAFEMYARGSMSIKPISNYFDTILVGQIFSEYKKLKPVIKKEIKMPEPTQEEKELLIYEGLIFCFDNWVQTNRIINGQVWVHDHLMELNLLDFTPEEKSAMWSLSKKNVLEKSKQLTYEEAKDVIREMERKTSNIRENEYKKLRLKYYFGKLKDSKKHIKDVI
jgi:hypothetical protein